MLEGDGDLFEVDQTKIGNELLDVYREAYQSRYGVQPVIRSNGSDATILKDLYRTYGFEMTKRFIQKFISMNDEWFVKKAHSLETLSKDLPKVNAALGQSMKREIQRGSGLMIRIWSYCDYQSADKKACLESWQLDIHSEKLNALRFCPKHCF